MIGNVNCKFGAPYSPVRLLSEETHHKSIETGNGSSDWIKLLTQVPAGVLEPIVNIRSARSHSEAVRPSRQSGELRAQNELLSECRRAAAMDSTDVLRIIPLMWCQMLQSIAHVSCLGGGHENGKCTKRDDEQNTPRGSMTS